MYLNVAGLVTIGRTPATTANERIHDLMAARKKDMICAERGNNA